MTAYLRRRLISIRATFVLSLFVAMALAGSAAFAQVDVSTGGPATTYPTLKDAFDAINAGTHTGTITIAITADTAETAPAVLNASGAGSASYTSIVISPTGGAMRTISGAIAAGSPLIDLNGADNVTIDGLNTGGNGLTISNTTVSATSGTSTIRFIGDATANTITNSSILGSSTMATTTNGGTIYFAAGAVTTGNDDNIISNNNIGPAGANLPTKAIYGNGSTTSTTTYNSGIQITGNNIFDYFNATAQSNGIYMGAANTGWTISNNRFYQTATRTQTGAGTIHSAIQAASGTGNDGHTISGNTIGFADSAGTGTYSLVGSGTGSKMLAIYFSASGTITPSSIQGNTIAGISLSGVVGGTGTTGAFTGINIVSSASVVNIGNIAGNTVGSAATPGSISITSNNASAMEVMGMYYFPSSNANVANNTVAGITLTNTGAGNLIFYGLRHWTGTTFTNTIQNNTVGTAAAPILHTSSATGSRVIGIDSRDGNLQISGNTISDLTSNSPNVGTGASAAMIGLWINATGTVGNNVTQNTIRRMGNTAAAAAVSVTGLHYNAAVTGTHVVQRNFIHSLVTLSSSASAVVNGINLQAGTATFQNNMIALGSDIGATSPQINGVNETAAGTNNFYHNSVYIGGAGVTSGSGNSFAFQSSIVTNVRNYRDNIFFNARSNGAATGKHYAIRVGGTAPNPAGLTSNNNILLANGTGGFTGLFNAIDQLTIADWRTATGQDFGSFAINPEYLAPTAATPDLHINPAVPTPIEGNGALIASVTDDFDGQARAGLTPTDIGADAGNFIGADLSAPGIVYTALANTTLTANRTLTATLTDSTGVATAGLSPRIYYRKNAGTYFSQACSLTGGTVNNGTWDCVINNTDMGGVVAGDNVGYFVIAQDTLGNIGSNPGGATATDVNTVTIPPTPNVYNIVTGISGSLNVGTGEAITSLTNAGGLFSVLNGGIVTGDLVVSLTSDLAGELGTFALNQLTEEGVGGYTLTIKPDVAPRLVTGTSTGANSGLIVLNGADRVTFDGSTSGGTDRSLTLTNLNTSGTVFWIRSPNASNGATNNTIENCIMTGSSGTTTIAGVLASGTVFGGDAEAPNSNNTIQNNEIKRVQNALYLRGGATSPGFDENWVVTNNRIGSTVLADKLGFRGMLIGNSRDFVVSDNEILGVSSSTTTSSTMNGIQVALLTDGGLIERNTIHDIRQNNTAGWGSAGITLGSGSAASGVDVFNNMIFDVASQGFDDDTPTDNGYGIVVATGGGYRIYHNSVALTNDQVNVNGRPAALNIASTVTAPGAVDLKNNIFANFQTIGNRYAAILDAPITVLADSDFNDYFAPITGRLLGVDQATLTDWQTAVGDDASSLAVDPLFVSTTNLHIAALSPMRDEGTALPAVTGDFDGDPRPAATPDIGADEIVEADLSITKDDGLTVVVPGGTTTYTIVVSNAGAHDVVGATVTDVFPAELTSCSTTCSGTPGTSCNAGPVVGPINDLANVPAGGSVTYIAVCNVTVVPGTINNTATVAAPGGVTDPTPANNTEGDSTTIQAQADVTITKTNFVDDVTAGDPVTYTIVVSNAGPSAASSVTVSDTFAAELLSCSTTCIGFGGGTCTTGPTAGNINDVANLPVGAAVIYTATCTVSPTASGSLVNTATATVGGGVVDPNTSDNSDEDMDNIINPNIFEDGFESGDTSAWSSTVPLTFALRGRETGEVTFGHDFESYATGRITETPIAVLVDEDGVAVARVDVRRSEAGAALELRLLAAGATASPWVPVGTGGASEVRLAWSSAASDGDGFVSLTVDGLLIHWSDGFQPAE